MLPGNSRRNEATGVVVEGSIGSEELRIQPEAFRAHVEHRESKQSPSRRW